MNCNNGQLNIYGSSNIANIANIGILNEATIVALVPFTPIRIIERKISIE